MEVGRIKNIAFQITHLPSWLFATKNYFSIVLALWLDCHLLLSLNSSSIIDYWGSFGEEHMPVLSALSQGESSLSTLEPSPPQLQSRVAKKTFFCRYTFHSTLMLLMPILLYWCDKIKLEWMQWGIFLSWILHTINVL